MTDPAGEYLDVDQIAAELRVHRQTVQRHFRDGTLPGRLVGHGWLTTRRALDEFVENRNPATGAPLTGAPGQPTRGGVPIETKDNPL